MSFDKYFSIPGWCPLELMKALNHTVSNMPTNQYYLEIGSFCGRSLVAALNGNDKKAVVIDPQNLVVGQTTTEIWWNKTINEFGVSDRIKLYKCRSDEFSGDLPVIGVFFYDGNHDSGWTYESLNKFSKYLADEAIIVVDDYLIRGGNEQIPYPGHLIEVDYPVKIDTDRWVAENRNNIEGVLYPLWLNGQAVISWKRK